MTYGVQPAVIGSAVNVRVSEQTRSLEEVIYEVTQAAIRDADITLDELDGIVVAANDQYDGRAIAVMAASGSVGGVGRDILSTPSAGEHAFVLGAMRVASGQFRTQLVVSWSPTEVNSLPEAQRLAADPYFHRRLPLDELSAHAFQAAVLEHAVPGLGDVAAAIVVKNREHAARAYPEVAVPVSDLDSVRSSRPIRWPLREAMIAPPVLGAAAAVLASPEFVKDRGIAAAAWVEGMGWATEPSFLGDRDLSAAPSLVSAARKAYDVARVTDPLAQIDLAEVADATPYQELLAYESLGFCMRGDWADRVAAGFFAADGGLPVNLSGGALAVNPTFCTGLIRIIEAANQLRGRAGVHQHRSATRGVAHAASGPAMQYNTVIVMRSDNPGVLT